MLRKMIIASIFWGIIGIGLYLVVDDFEKKELEKISKNENKLLVENSRLRMLKATGSFNKSASTQAQKVQREIDDLKFFNKVYKENLTVWKIGKYLILALVVGCLLFTYRRASKKEAKKNICTANKNDDE